MHSSRPTHRVASSLASEVPTATANAFRRARQLRNSEFALNPVSSSKRTRSMFEIDSEEDDYEDNSRDAQLARALQDEENLKADLVSIDPVAKTEPGRPGRPRRSTVAKTSYAYNPSDDFDEADDDFALKPASKKAKVSSLKKNKSRYIFSDSDEESEFNESDTSNEDEDGFPLALNSSARKAASSMAETPDITMPDDDFSMLYSPLDVLHLQTANRRRSIAGARSRVGRGTRSVGRGRQAVPSEPSGIPPDADDDEVAGGGLEDLAADDDNSDAPDVSNMNPEERREYTRECRARANRKRLETNHPEIITMWKDLEDLPNIPPTKADQPANISRELKPFQLEGLNWMKMMEKTKWGGGLLGDEMGMGKTIQAVSLIMSDYPAKNPSLVLIPPVAIMQWQQEIEQYTDGTLKTFVYHGTNSATKGITVAALKKYDVILMSYNSLESLYRFQEKGRKRKDETVFQKSPIHQIQFHRVILDEAHNIKVSSLDL